MNVPDTVRDILSRATITETTLRLPPEQLDRTTYSAVDKVLKAAGGKWNRSGKVHVFDSDPREALGMAVNEGTIVNQKTELQAFYTPDDLADTLVGYARLREDETVLEPSCGDGAIVRAILRHPNMVPDDVVATDIAQHAADLPVGVDFIQDDFLRDGHQQWLRNMSEYDVVIMNPPFTKGQATAHVRTALKLAKRVLVAVMPPTWQHSKQKNDVLLREELHADFDWRVVNNPPGSFKEAGTNVNTVTLIAERLDY